MHRNSDNQPERVTMAYLHERLADVKDRIGRLEKVVTALVVAVALPKFGGPSPAELITSAAHVVSTHT